MKKVLLGLVVLASCAKKTAVTDIAFTGEENNKSVKANALSGEFPELTTCVHEYFNKIFPGPDDGTAFQQLLQCQGNMDMPEPSEDPPYFNPKRRLCYECTEWVGYQNQSTFPALLSFLGLNNSSTKAEIAAVHDYLQKFNNIIRAAIPFSYSPLSTKRDAVMLYYHDTYLLNNPPLTDEELNFLIQYTGLLFWQDMYVYPGWAYKLYYPGSTPPSGNPSDDGLFLLEELDPATGMPFGFSTWDDGFLASIGITQASPALTGSPIPPVIYYMY